MVSIISILSLNLLLLWRSPAMKPRSNYLPSPTTLISTCSVRSMWTVTPLTRCGSGWRSSPTGEASWGSEWSPPDGFIAPTMTWRCFICYHLLFPNVWFSFLFCSSIKWNFTKVNICFNGLFIMNGDFNVDSVSLISCFTTMWGQNSSWKKPVNASKKGLIIKK